MKIQSTVIAAAIFALGAVMGHAVTSTQKIGDEASIGQVSTFELTMKATSLPVQTADAI